MTKVLSKTGANILEILHDRNAPYIELQQSIVKATLETKGPVHTESILSTLKKHYKIL